MPGPQVNYFPSRFDPVRHAERYPIVSRPIGGRRERGELGAPSLFSFPMAGWLGSVCCVLCHSQPVRDAASQLGWRQGAPSGTERLHATQHVCSCHPKGDSVHVQGPTHCCKLVAPLAMQR